MKPVEVYIGLGSNLEDPEGQIKSAVKEIDQLEKSRLTAESGLFRSRPMGPQDQPYYINAVMLIETELEAVELLDRLQQIELDHGRVRQRHWGERTLDLDILLYDDQQIQSERLTIPHPGMAEREFVLYPLNKINPDLAVPGKGPLKDLLKACPENGIEYLG